MVDFGDFTPGTITAIGADSQAGRILARMQDGQTIGPREALRDFGCMRLAARIYDLRRTGHRIEDRVVRAGRKSWTIYWISKTPATGQLFT